MSLYYVCCNNDLNVRQYISMQCCTHMHTDKHVTMRPQVALFSLLNAYSDVSAYSLFANMHIHNKYIPLL